MSVVAPLNSNASFQCTANGSVFWNINGGQVTSPEVAQSFATFDIFAPLSTPYHSEVIINATERNNGTEVQCLVEEEGNIRVLDRSEVVTLQVFGESVQ